MIQVQESIRTTGVGTRSLTAVGAAPESRRGVVSGELVHRTDREDIFPTGWTRLTDTRFLVSVHWPRAHRFFSPVSGRQDPLLVAETIRQATMMLAHAEFGVPVGDQFVMWDLAYTTAVPGFLVGEASGDITLDLTCSQVKRRGQGLGGMHVAARFLRRGTGALLAASSGRISCTSARVYRRLRGEQLSAAGRRVPLIAGIPPRAAGRTAERDVVLAPTWRRHVWQLRLDTAHPTLFGRPNDHVPGILLVEAARQAANAVDPEHVFFPTSVDIAFHRYAELDRACWIGARILPSDDEATTMVRIEGVQDDELVFTGTLGHAHAPTCARAAAHVLQAVRT